MIDLTNKIKEISLDLENLSLQILDQCGNGEERKRAKDDGWYKFIKMVYIDSLNKCFKDDSIFSFVVFVCSSFEKNKILQSFYTTNFEESKKISKILQFLDKKYFIKKRINLEEGNKIITKRKKNIKKKTEIIKNNKFDIPLSIYNLVSDPFQNSLSKNFYLNQKEINFAINKMAKNYKILFDCVSNKHLLSMIYNEDKDKEKENLLKYDFKKLFEFNIKKLKENFQNEFNKEFKDIFEEVKFYLSDESTFNKIKNSNKFLEEIFCKNCQIKIEFWNLCGNEFVCKKQKMDQIFLSLPKRETQYYSLNQNQINHAKLNFKEQKKFSFKNCTKLKINEMNNPILDLENSKSFEQMKIKDEEFKKFRDWITNSYDIKNKWNTLENKFIEKNESFKKKKNNNKKIKKKKLNKDLKIIKEYNESIEESKTTATISASNIYIGGFWKELISENFFPAKKIK